jgi:hypothetical protein
MIDPLGAAPDRGLESTTAVALLAAMQRNQAWLATLEHSAEETQPPDAQHPGALPPIGIEGAGLLVLDDKGVRAFARVATLHVAPDGRLLDDQGRAALGYDLTTGSRRVTELRVPTRDIGADRYASYQIDDRGHFWGVIRGSVGHASASEQQVLLGRLAVAVFPAPDRLHDAGNVSLATSSAGVPRYVPADAPHVGPLRQHPQEPSQQALSANLRELWNASGKAEIDVALTASRDSIERTALDLVR